jgi:hypothetical protein
VRTRLLFRPCECQSKSTVPPPISSICAAP